MGAGAAQEQSVQRHRVLRSAADRPDEQELVEIITRNATKLKTEVSAEAATEMARRSRGTPRKANNLLRWSRDYATSRGDGKITDDLARQALEMRGVDIRGLEGQDRKYLTVLSTVFTGGPAGLNAIAHTMNIPPDTLEDEVEPYLLQVGFIQRTPRGRMLTPEGRDHISE